MSGEYCPNLGKFWASFGQKLYVKLPNIERIQHLGQYFALNLKTRGKLIRYEYRKGQSFAIFAQNADISSYWALTMVKTCPTQGKKVKSEAFYFTLPGNAQTNQYFFDRTH